MLKDLYLVGAGGGPNFGDDLIGRVWVEYLANKYPNRTIWLDTRNAGITAGYFSKYKNVKAVNTFWKLREMSAKAGDDLELRIEWLEKKIKNLGTPSYDIHISNLKENVESIHFIGGGYINSIWPANILLLAQACILKNINLSLKIYATGLGLTPVTDEFSRLFKKITSNFDYIEGRDIQSAESLEVTRGIDDVWMSFSNKMSETKPIWREKGVSPDIMVLLQKDFNNGKEQQLLTKALELIRTNPAYSSATKIGVAEGYPSKDYWVYPILKKVLPNNDVSFYSFQSLWEKGFPAGENTTWITTRFHYHLIASALGSKGIIITTGSKYYDIKHQSLLSSGTGWNVMNLDDTLNVKATRNEEWKANATKMGNEKMLLAEKLYYFAGGGRDV